MNRLRQLVLREPQRGLALPAWLTRLLSVGIVATEPQLVRRQRCVNVACLAAVANSFGHLVVNSLYDFSGLVIVNAYNVLMILVGLLLPQLHRLGANLVAIILTILIVLGQLFLVWAVGITSDLHIYLTLTGALVFFFGVQSWKLFLGFFAFVALALLFALNFAPVDGFVLPTDGHLRELLSSHAFMNTVMVNAVMVFYALAALHQAEVELEQQYERSEALVTTVLPATIAARLKSGTEERIADSIDNLSVLFADLVGFTAAARDVSPAEVVGFLDSLVLTFDALAQARGVEKIKTAGDSYMAAAGFDGRAREGAVAIGRFALAILAANDRRPPLGSARLALRVGIHCGPATAGVIGDTRFTYDVWGDAVNVASRMESHGEPGRIQVSEAFRDLAGDDFAFTERGPTELKGIGEARTWFLGGEQVRT